MRSTRHARFTPSFAAHRRSILKGGVAILSLPLLNACGGSDTTGNAACERTASGGTHVPRGVHASWTGDPRTTRTVTWFTDGGSDPGTVIEYGPVEPGMDDCAIDTAAFPARAEGDTQATYGVDALTHSATATGLDPAKAVRYRVGSDVGGWSKVSVLPAAPATDDFRFCFYGDQGVYDASRAVIAGVQARKPDFLFIAGDISYADGDQPVWDAYFDMLEPLAAQLPVMACPGNHEAKDGVSEGYKTRFVQPGQNTYYSFRYGRVHFCVGTGGSLVKAEHPRTITEFLAELAWMELDLAKAARQRAAGEIDFVIFVQHYTLWTNCEGRDPGNFTAIAFEEHMMLRHGVDLVLVGHDHIYERSKPMAYGRPRDNGYVQITQGGGGRGLYELIPDIADWSAISTVRHGFTELAVEGTTIRCVTYGVENNDVDLELLPQGDLVVFDRFEIRARNAEERAKFAAVRGKSKEMEAFDYDAMIRHTIERNELHDLHEHSHHTR